MKTSITISLLPSSPRMPFVLGPKLDPALETAASLGFDAVEVFPPTVDAIDQSALKRGLAEHSLKLSTIGTGGGAVSQGLTLTDPDPTIRTRAIKYIREIMQIAAEFDASAIIGSMQGKAASRDRAEVLSILADSINELDRFASELQQPLFYEPLNRYESDLTCTLRDAADLIKSAHAGHTRILADLFHMNIEEQEIAASIEEFAELIGHVHFVDSNRQVAGQGHTPFEPIVASLIQANYRGYLAVEAFPLPDQNTAAKNAIESIHNLNLKIA